MRGSNCGPDAQPRPINLAPLRWDFLCGAAGKGDERAADGFYQAIWAEVIFGFVLWLLFLPARLGFIRRGKGHEKESRSFLCWFVFES